MGRFRYLRYRNGSRKRRWLPNLLCTQAQTLPTCIGSRVGHGRFGRGGSQMGSPLNQILVQGIGQFDEPTPRYTTVQDVHRYEQAILTSSLSAVRQRQLSSRLQPHTSSHLVSSITVYIHPSSCPRRRQSVSTNSSPLLRLGQYCLQNGFEPATPTARLLPPLLRHCTHHGSHRKRVRLPRHWWRLRWPRQCQESQWHVWR